MGSCLLPPPRHSRGHRQGLLEEHRDSECWGPQHQGDRNGAPRTDSPCSRAKPLAPGHLPALPAARFPAARRPSGAVSAATARRAPPRDPARGTRRGQGRSQASAWGVAGAPAPSLPAIPPSRRWYRPQFPHLFLERGSGREADSGTEDEGADPATLGPLGSRPDDSGWRGGRKGNGAPATGSPPGLSPFLRPPPVSPVPRPYLEAAAAAEAAPAAGAPRPRLGAGRRPWSRGARGRGAGELRSGSRHSPPAQSRTPGAGRAAQRWPHPPAGAPEVPRAALGGAVAEAGRAGRAGRAQPPSRGGRAFPERAGMGKRGGPWVPPPPRTRGPPGRRAAGEALRHPPKTSGSRRR